MSKTVDQNRRLLKILYVGVWIALLLAVGGYQIGKGLAQHDRAVASQR